MRQLLIIVSFSVALIFNSCKGKQNKEESQENVTNETSRKENNESASPSTADKNSRWEQRKAKGDTLALPYKDLQAYLPEVSGYTKDGGPKGSQMNMPGMGSWSQAEQNYVNGEKQVSVKMMDYNAAFQTFQGVTAAYGMAFSFEDDSKKQDKVDLGEKDVAAYATIYKTEKRGEMVVIAADRFFITIDSNGDNDEAFIKSVAKAINLNKLAGM